MSSQPSSAWVKHRLIEAIPPRRWMQLGVVYLLLGTAAAVLAQSADAEAWWLHGLWCFVGLALALPTLKRAFGHGFAVVLTDHRLMFLASFSLYFLFGAALLAVGPAIQIEHSLSYYRIDARDALRVDAVNGLGFGIALVAASLARGRWLGKIASKAASRAAGIPSQLVIGAFLLLGGVASYYLALFDLGFRGGFVPGIVRSAGNFVLVAVYLASAHRGRGERTLRTVAVVLVVVLLLLGVLQFNKSAALLPLLALTSGLAARFGARKVLPVGLAVALAGYLMLGNLTVYGRSIIADQSEATLSERWQFIKEGWQATRGLSEEEEYGTWARLDYTASSTAGLDLRDAGRGGDGMQLLPWVVVPRLIFPDKPEITKTGRELNTKITGGVSSSTGQGIFASGYYHAGWLGVLIASVLCGWIVAQTSAIARAIHLQNALLMLPLSLLGLLIAFRIDGDFVADYAGAFMFIVYPLLGAGAILSVAKSARSRPPNSSGGSGN